MSSTALGHYLGVKVNMIKPEILPELMLLGTLEQTRVPMDDGQLMDLSIIHYDGKMYFMKEECVGRWFDER
jgi:hypothetical protein